MILLVILKANKITSPKNPINPGINIISNPCNMVEPDINCVIKIKIARNKQKAPPIKASKSIILLNFRSNHSMKLSILLYY